MRREVGRASRSENDVDPSGYEKSCFLVLAENEIPGAADETREYRRFFI